MVLTAGQQAAFFANQMLVPATTRNRMVLEGASTVEDLLECNEDMLDSLEDRLRKPGQGIAPFVFSPATKNRLLQASQLMKHCPSERVLWFAPSFRKASRASCCIHLAAMTRCVDSLIHKFLQH